MNRRTLTALAAAAALTAAGCSSPVPMSRTVTFDGPDGPGPAGFTSATTVDAADTGTGTVTGTVTVSGARIATFDASRDGDTTSILLELDSVGLTARSTLTADTAAALFPLARPVITTSPAGLVTILAGYDLATLGCAVAWAITGTDDTDGCDTRTADGTMRLDDGTVTATGQADPSPGDTEPQFRIDDGTATPAAQFIDETVAAGPPAIVLLGDTAAIAAQAATAGGDAVPPEGVTVTVLPDGRVQATAATESACNTDGTVTAGECR